jgi:hypothetical protein
MSAVSRDGRQHVPGSVLALLPVYAYNPLLASYRRAACEEQNF